MGRVKGRSAFTLNKRNGIWYARFWSEEEQRYFATRSTGQSDKGRAGREAQKMLDRGDIIPRSSDCLLLEYAKDYWQKPAKGVSKTYREQNCKYIDRLFKCPKANRLKLSQTHRGKLYLIQDWLSSRYGGRTVNRMMQALLVPVRVAVRRDRIKHDPTGGFSPVAENKKRKRAFTADEVRAMIAWTGEIATSADRTVRERRRIAPREHRRKCIVLLGALAGLRRGEMRALRWRAVDLKAGNLSVEENYIDGEGIKTPKDGSRREIVIHPALSRALKRLRSVSPYTDPDDFVIPQSDRHSPVGASTVRLSFEAVMDDIGLAKAVRRERGLDYHGLRRTFVTHARQALPDYAVQSMAGHATARMTKETYSDTRIIELSEYRERFAAMYAEK